MKIIYFELRFPTGKARACSLETLSIPSGVLLKIKCVNGNGANGVIRLMLSFIFIFNIENETMAISVNVNGNCHCFSIK